MLVYAIYVVKAHKQSILNKSQIACLSHYIIDEQYGAKYMDFFIDQNTGGLIPIMSLIPMITAGQSNLQDFF